MKTAEPSKRKRNYRWPPFDANGKKIPRAEIRLSDLKVVETTAADVEAVLQCHPGLTENGEDLTSPEALRTIAEVRVWTRHAFNPFYDLNLAVDLREIQALCGQAGRIAGVEMGHVVVGMTLAGYRTARDSRRIWRANVQTQSVKDVIAEVLLQKMGRGRQG